MPLASGSTVAPGARSRKSPEPPAALCRYEGLGSYDERAFALPNVCPELRARREPPRRGGSAAQQRVTPRLVLLHGSADQPEHRGPEADEECAALSVASLILVDRSSPNPEANAQEDVRRAKPLEVAFTHACAM